MSSTKASKATRPIDQLIFDAFAPNSDSATPKRHVQPPRSTRRRQDTVKVGLLALAAALIGSVALAGPALFGSTTSASTPSSTVVSGEASAAVAPAPAAAADATESAPAAAATEAAPAAPAPAAPAPAAGAAIKVENQGFTRLAPEPDGDRKVAYAAVLRNPRTDQVALDVQTVVTFTGRGGATLKIEDEKLDAILAGQTGALADETELAGVTGIRVQVTGVGSWASAKGFEGKLSASGVRTTRVAGTLTTTATVRSTLARNIGDADAVAVYFDKAGRVIGGQREGIEFIPARGSVPVLLDTSKALPGIAKTAVYANTDPFDIDD